jgi:chemotaxis protein histidine kinase CheA
MTKMHENKLTMYLAVASVLDDNGAKIATLAALTQATGTFEGLIEAVKEKSKEFDLMATGMTLAKLEAEDQLLEELMPAIHALYAYAHTVKDTTLAEKANISESSVRKLRDTEIIVKTNGLLEIIEAHVAKLADHGVTAETVATIRQKIDAYEGALEKKEGTYSERVSTNKALYDLYDQTDAVLAKQIDPLMEQFRRKEVDFYNAYTQARWIKTLGGWRKSKPATTPMPAVVSAAA